MRLVGSVRNVIGRPWRQRGSERFHAGASLSDPIRHHAFALAS
jgi:hypothetical protein